MYTRVLCRYSSFHLRKRKGGPTFWYYPRHSTISRSRPISSQRPKCSKLAQAGTNAYDAVGNRRVNVISQMILDSRSTHRENIKCIHNDSQINVIEWNGGRDVERFLKNHGCHIRRHQIACFTAIGWVVIRRIIFFWDVSVKKSAKTQILCN